LAIRQALILSAAIPDEIRAEISTAYESLSKQSDTNNLGVAVRAVQQQKTYRQQVLPDKWSLS
jgi:phosphoenolpyruvate synthase/pyruvate phosphate dikinase